MHMGLHAVAQGGLNGQVPSAGACLLVPKAVLEPAEQGGQPSTKSNAVNLQNVKSTRLKQAIWRHLPAGGQGCAEANRRHAAVQHLAAAGSQLLDTARYVGCRPPSACLPACLAACRPAWYACKENLIGPTKRHTTFPC